LEEAGLLVWLKSAIVGALAWLRLVEPVELVFGCALGGFAGDSDSLCGWRWQPTMAVVVKAIRTGSMILFFMVR